MHGLGRLRFRLGFCLAALSSFLAAADRPVQSSEGEISIPTYEHVGREMEPPLFPSSVLAGMYPFTTYLLPYKGAPEPRKYDAVFLENEYLKLTYIPDFGGRIFSVYDKLRHREMFYRNDVIKPAPYNPRNSWPQSGLELTGPHDLHTLTLHGEPFWAHQIVKQPDDSVTLLLSELDPVYGMEVHLSATLHPGIAAIEIGVFCYNMRDGRMPQMFWINSAISATPQTRFIYPMSRTVGHTTADVADWPLYNGTDYSWDRNNKHMLGVFGIDSYDNFQGAYQFDRQYGIFRYADRRVVQGMKLWTFGYGQSSKSFESGYTDHAGPYVELQSGRHVWDGHYEWLAPHKVETWHEWWIPVSQTDGLTTLTRDIALNMEGMGNAEALRLAIASVRKIAGARLSVKRQDSEIFSQSMDLDPALPFRTAIQASAAGWKGVEVVVKDAGGEILLDYLRPDENLGRKEYTPFTKALEQPHKPPEAMSAEELTIAAEFRLKELDEPGAQKLFELALARDPGYSRAHLLIGLSDFQQGRYEKAERQLTQAIERDPYADEAYYYLALAQFALRKDAPAERNLYYIWPNSAYYGNREFQLGRLAMLKPDYASAIDHFRSASLANGTDLLARAGLAVALRKCGQAAEARSQLAGLASLDRANRLAQAELWFLDGDEKPRAELLRLLGGQSQEGLATVKFYRDLGLWKDATKLLELVQRNNRDPWGTSPEFYYTLAFCERLAGSATEANETRKKAQAAAANVDRFPYREESEAPLREAVELNPKDTVARFNLACLLYFRGKPAEAIRQWEAEVALNVGDFPAHRALGLAYAEQGLPVNKAAAQLEQAVELRPAHVRTFDDLSALYAKAGRFDDQLTVLRKALQRSPEDDDLEEGLLTAYLNKGSYQEAERLIDSHTFAPKHRTYSLRDKYRLMRCGLGAKMFNHGEYMEALRQFQMAARPPVSLGIDDFQSQTSPRIYYYTGRALEAMGKNGEAHRAYEKAITGMQQLSGDRDSWNSENFFTVLSLERLGRGAEAAQLSKHFSTFAEVEKDAVNPLHRSEARYLLGLISENDRHPKEAGELFSQALAAEPDLLAARLELRGDAVGPIASTKPN